MKKFFYVAAAFLAAGFVSCSENNGDDFTTPVVEGSDLAPIRFDLGAGRVNIEQKAAATRGKGAVGDLDGTNNVWNGEELKVYMFDKGTLDLALDKTATGKDSEGNDYSTMPLFENASIIATAGATLVETATQKYYPMQGNFDFFAYHVDNAATVTNGVAANPTLNVDGDQYIIPVTIDGSQDLMVAKAELQDGEAEKLGDARKDDYYSAFSARKEVNPHFKFQHLLTRFVFNVKADAEVKVDDVKIKGVKISEANTTADMVVAYTTAPTEFLNKQANPATVSLQGIAVDGKKPSKDKFEKIGESLLLMPQASYEVEFVIEQTVNGAPRNINYPATLSAKELGIGDKFVAGNQYNVNLTLYGLSDIVLKLQLQHWVDGGDINVDDNNDKNVQWVKPEDRI